MTEEEKRNREFLEGLAYANRDLFTGLNRIQPVPTADSREQISQELEALRTAYQSLNISDRGLVKCALYSIQIETEAQP